MFKTLLKKDILLMLKDLRIHIFMGIILILYILSSLTYSNEFKKEQKKFQQSINNSYETNKQYAENILRLISKGNLKYYQNPLVENIILDKRGFPNKMASSVTAFTPYILSKRKHTKNNMNLNWIFIIGVLESFIALLFSYDAISKEKKSGTLRLKIVNNISRTYVFLSKYLAIIFLFCFSNFLGILFSLTIIFLFFNGIAMTIIIGAFSLFILSIFFLSFFIISGLLISMSKNYRSNIVIALAFWLLFIFIIPNLSYIFGERFFPIMSKEDYWNKKSSERSKVYEKWSNKYDDRATRIYKVGGNVYIKEGYRTAAVYEMDNAGGKINKKRLIQALNQINYINKIAYISPYVIMESALLKLLEIGSYRFKRELEQFEKHQNYLEDKFKKIDQQDKSSLHLYYSWAFGDRGVIKHEGLVPFTDQPYPDPHELILTKYQKDSFNHRLKKSIPDILFLLFLNLIVFSFSIIKISYLDVR